MFFETIISKYYDNDNVKRIIDGSREKRATTIRINTLKTDKQSILNLLEELSVDYKEVDYNINALIIQNNEELIRNSENYKNGEIYFQSLSSQLPPILLSPSSDTDILDMCAAPGGKTSQLAAITHNKCNITACEMNKIRAERLKYNLSKLGVKGANVMLTDARNIESYFSFDKILLDAPCSGSGTLNIENPKSLEGFSDVLINKCVASQKKLLDKAVSVLKKGGEILYSTCSVLPVENEEIVKPILDKYELKTVELDQNIVKHLPLLPCSLENAVCVCPTKEYEGFFLVKITKK